MPEKNKPYTKPQLYLHIGHPKTASSTLQSFLFQNAQHLEAAGYTLPTDKLTCTTSQSPAGNPLWALEAIRETGDASPIKRWIAEAGKQATSQPKLILSSECMAQSEWPLLFADMVDHAHIHLIYYVRRQDQLLLSAWRQWGLKRGLSLDDFIKRRLANKQPDFLSIVRGWLDAVDLASHHVRFIQAPFLQGKDIIEDFCTHIGFDPKDCTPTKNENISIDARLLLFMSNHRELFSSVHDEEIFTLLSSPNTKEPEQRLKLSAQQFQHVQETFEPLNQSLLQECQPALTGTAVIDVATGSGAANGDLPDEAAQLAYVRERMAATPNQSHPKLVQLRDIIGHSP
ncbi:MAG: hypothetical protein KUG56_03680 [Kordiimonadaceae bacterium]|nr:hypothetical protein [Kordiimonadaceae bacterium]